MISGHIIRLTCAVSLTACLSMSPWGHAGELLTFPMSETGDDQREYAIRAPLTSGDGNHWMGGGLLSCKVLQGKNRPPQVETQFTTEGKALCHRLSKLRGLVEVKVHDYTVQVTKAKAFSWEELDAALQQSFTGL